MEEQNNPNFENQEPETKEEIQAITPRSKKSTLKKVIMIASVAIAVVAVTLFLILVVFKHEHTWSEWELEVEKTCTTNGVNTRYCTDSKCGEVESLTFYAKGHNMKDATCTSPKICYYCGYTEGAIKEHVYSKGKCVSCYKWMPLNVTVPDAPIVTLDRYLGGLRFTNFSYGWGFDSNNSFDLYLHYDAEVLSGENRSCYFRYKVIDSNGYTVGSGYYWTATLSKGDKVKDVSFCVATDLDTKGTYTIIISDYQ